MRRGAPRVVSFVVAASAAVCLLLSVSPAAAQSSKKNLTRSFDGNPYAKIYDFFTATGSEAVLTFNRVIGTCPEIGNCNNNGQCHGGTCVAGHCTGDVYVYPTVGQVAVIKKDDFCRALVCGSGGGAFVPPECNPAQYPCTTPCPVPTSCSSCPLAPGLCACDGGNECPAADAPLTSGQVAFNETFQTATLSGAWNFSRATLHPGSTDGFLEMGVDPLQFPSAQSAVAQGTVRFPLVTGAQYVLFVKHSFTPTVGGLSCYPFGKMELHFEGRPDVCDQDGDGFPVANDCDDGNGFIHPGQVDSCNGVDEDCDGSFDEDFASKPDLWTPVPVSPSLESRFQHSLVSTGSKAIVWGGRSGGPGFQTGGLYDPAGGAWTPLPTTGAPSERYDHTAVWTGTRMIVWGGNSFAGSVRTGGLYNPASNTWTGSTSLTGAPQAVTLHTAVWSGTDMIVWGGFTGGLVSTRVGGLYNPGSDSWKPTTLTNAPAARSSHTAVWTGSKMIVWGGDLGFGEPTNTGAIYDPVSDSWTPLPLASAPSPRMGHTAVWTGSEMIVWGGQDGFANPIGGGGRFNPTSGTWSSLSSAGAPTPRYGHVAVWTGSEMVIWGGAGLSGVTPADIGAVYRVSDGSWAPVTDVGNPSARKNAKGVFLTGPGRMLVWGGDNQGTPLGDGGLYLPNTVCGTGICQSAGGTTCVNGSLQYACVPGFPLSEECNGLDDDCNGVTDDGVLPVTGTPDLTLTQSGAFAAIVSSALPSGQGSDLVRGRILPLRSSGGNYTSSTENCLLWHSPDRTYFDTSTPPLGDAYWYLSRDNNFCTGPGTFDEGVSSQIGLRDAEIAASPAACPP